MEGADHCISLFCRDGKVLKQVVYEHSHGAFRFFENAALARVAAHIVKELNLIGPDQFRCPYRFRGRYLDDRVQPALHVQHGCGDGGRREFRRLEFTVRAASALTGKEIRVPDALLRRLLGFRKPRAADWRMLAHWLKDPLVFALVAIGYQQRWRLPLFEKVMTSGKCAA